MNVSPVCKAKVTLQLEMPHQKGSACLHHFSMFWNGNIFWNLQCYSRKGFEDLIYQTCINEWKFEINELISIFCLWSLLFRRFCLVLKTEGTFQLSFLIDDTGMLLLQDYCQKVLEASYGESCGKHIVHQLRLFHLFLVGVLNFNQIHCLAFLS